MVCFLFCPAEVPTKVTSKGSRGIAQKQLLEKQNNPHQFALGLKDAPSAELACWCESAHTPFCLSPPVRSPARIPFTQLPWLLRRAVWVHGMLGEKGRPRQV